MPMPEALHIISFTKHLETIKKFYTADADFKTFWDDQCACKINSEKFKWKLSEDDMGYGLEYQHLANGFRKRNLIITK